jgi:hypothetical protein
MAQPQRQQQQLEGADSKQYSLPCQQQQHQQRQQ